VPDSTLNAYLRTVKLIVEDAEKNLSRKQLEAFRAVLARVFMEPPR
jgi:hypothetical protein